MQYIYVYIHMQTHIYIYIYKYIYRERGRDMYIHEFKEENFRDVSENQTTFTWNLVKLLGV